MKEQQQWGVQRSSSNWTSTNEPRTSDTTKLVVDRVSCQHPIVCSHSIFHQTVLYHFIHCRNILELSVVSLNWDMLCTMEKVVPLFCQFVKINLSHTVTPRVLIHAAETNAIYKTHFTWLVLHVTINHHLSHNISIATNTSVPQHGQVALRRRRH